MRSIDYGKQWPSLGKDVFWVVGNGMPYRHATRVRPGAVPHGEWVPALCETWFRMAYPTPHGREPASKAITRRCPRCVGLVADGEYSSGNWDF